MIAVVGDSIAKGLQVELRAPESLTQVGIGSRAGVAMDRHTKASTLVVSLGINDLPESPRFEARVRLLLQGRKRVVWLTMRRHPRYNAELRRIARIDARLRVVDGIVRTVDGTHPADYSALARRVRKVLKT